jgi:2,3-bisphosphoglycerate-independent phosphoglycerate mutase
MTKLALAKHRTFSGVKGPVVVVVMDGVGVAPAGEGNACSLARTPTLDWLRNNTANTTLRAHGTAVGLPSDDDMGNSEVGHNALGAGRVFDQGAKLVNAAISSGALFRGECWQAIVSRVRERNSTLHFIGLLSDGNVHSHEQHLFALLDGAAREGVARARVHALLDGRDVPETSALEYVDKLEAKLASLRSAARDYRVASGGGRMKVTMDRYEAEWAMVERGWKLHVRGEGQGFSSLRAAVEGLREQSPGISDQNLPGFVIVERDGAPVGPIRDGDAVVLFNFRGDRAIEITRAFEQESFSGFDRGPRPDVLFAGMMQYDGDLRLPSRFLVSPPEIDRTLSEHLAESGLIQLACSETQKFGHVTYFWNGNRSTALAGERWIEVESDTLPFQERPWMKAAEITDRVIAELCTGGYHHGRVNYANGDMVGHTGARDAAVLAVEAVDLSIARLLPVISSLNGALIVTADHGNADEMYELDKKSKQPLLDKNGKPRPKTSHTLNPVPLFVYAPSVSVSIDASIQGAGLANVAATTLHMMGYEAPEGYQPSLLAR